MNTAKPENLKVIKDLGRPGILFSVARQPDSTRLFFGASDAKVYDLDVMAEKPEPTEYVGHESYVTGVALAGKYLVSGGYDGRLIWWDTETKQQVRSVLAHSRWIREVTATPDGRFVVSVADDMVCRIWDVERGILVRDLRGHELRTPHHFPSMLYTCTISADGRYLATGDRVGKNIVWDLSNGRRLATIETPIMYTWDPKQRIHSIGGVRSLAFSHDSKLLAAGGIGTIGNIDHLGGPSRCEVFDWQKGERTHEFSDDKFKGLFERLEFHPSGNWLLGAGGDHNGFIKCLDLSTSKVIKEEKAPMHVHDLVVNETFDTIYAAGHGKAVVWSLQA
jgi:WD40 repeat protein